MQSIVLPGAGSRLGIAAEMPGVRGQPALPRLAVTMISTLVGTSTRLVLMTRS